MGAWRSYCYSCIHTNKNMKQEKNQVQEGKWNEVLTVTELLAAWVPRWSLSVCLPDNLQPVGDTQSFRSPIKNKRIRRREPWKYYQRSWNCLFPAGSLSAKQQQTPSDTLTKHTRTSPSTSFSSGSLFLLSPLRRSVSSEENSANSTAASLSEFTSPTLPTQMRHSGCKVTFCVFWTMKIVFGNFTIVYFRPGDEKSRQAAKRVII